METEYQTIEAFAQDMFVEKRSKFICAAAPAATEEEALRFIKERRERFWDAAHTVYAYRIREGNLSRYSDDGEPQGTGGIPVLDVIRKEGLVDVAVAVTRYFGGTLLGAGGLVRAYSGGASLALHAAKRVTMSLCAECEIRTDYSWYGTVSKLLPQFGAKTLDSAFTEEVRLRFLIREDRLISFESALREATAARAAAKVLEKRFAPLG